MKNKKVEKKSALSSSSFLPLFNYLGGTFIFLGLLFFLVLNWYSLNPFLKIACTLGSGIAAYLIGVLFFLNPKQEALGSAFFQIAALMLPVGLYVSVDRLGWPFPIEEVNVYIMALCFCFFLLTFLFYQRTLFLLFILIYGSLFFVSLTNLIFQHSSLSFTHLTNYEFISLGISYILLGRYLDLDKKFPLSGPLYFFGVLFIL